MICESGILTSPSRPVKQPPIIRGRSLSESGESTLAENVCLQNPDAVSSPNRTWSLLRRGLAGIERVLQDDSTPNSKAAIECLKASLQKSPPRENITVIPARPMTPMSTRGGSSPPPQQIVYTPTAGLGIPSLPTWPRTDAAVIPSNDGDFAGCAQLHPSAMQILRFPSVDEQPNAATNDAFNAVFASDSPIQRTPKKAPDQPAQLDLLGPMKFFIPQVSPVVADAVVTSMSESQVTRLIVERMHASQEMAAMAYSMAHQPHGATSATLGTPRRHAVAMNGAPLNSHCAVATPRKSHCDLDNLGSTPRKPHCSTVTPRKYSRDALAPYQGTTVPSSIREATASSPRVPLREVLYGGYPNACNASVHVVGGISAYPGSSWKASPRSSYPSQVPRQVSASSALVQSTSSAVPCGFLATSKPVTYPIHTRPSTVISSPRGPSFSVPPRSSSVHERSSKRAGLSSINPRR